MTQFILQFHTLGLKINTRMDFVSDKSATEFIELSMLNGYKMYQYIQSDFTYVMPIDELEQEKIKFEKLYREKKTWFGFSKKTITDLLILPNNGFFYPYEYGHYLYIFTKKELTKADLEKWLNKEFPSRYGNIDETFPGFDNLMNKDDYLIATNHDMQNQFGVIGNKSEIEQIISKFKDSTLNEFELEEYEDTRR